MRQRHGLLMISLLLSFATGAGAQSIVLVPDRVLDGRGGVAEGVQVTVTNGKIQRVAPLGATGVGVESAGVGLPTGVGVPSVPVQYDLAGTTLLPGLIDTHVHIDWYFDRFGRTRTNESTETPAQQTLYSVENAYLTILGGVTTVQSLGAPSDVDLRDGIARGVIPGPRVLTSIRAISEETGDPAAIRAEVASLAEAGADVIKIFASASIRVGGTPTMSQEQLDAACGEAAGHGLRAVVHAHGPESARRAVAAGCTTIEHGALLDRETLELMASKGVYYDPNIDLVLRNYFEHADHFIGFGGYTEEGFEQMRAAVPKVLATFRTALEVPELQIVFGTDALAGAHGRNVEELIYRIREGRQPAADAIVSATSLAAKSLGLEDRIGTVAPGFEADLIAVEGNPLVDPGALKRVVFVMKEGRVYLSPP